MPSSEYLEGWRAAVAECRRLLANPSERVIVGMCTTDRHDFGLIKTDGDSPLNSGMTLSQRDALRSRMGQIWYHNISGYLNDVGDPPTEERYFVRGGVYEDVTFRNLLHREEYGPFPTYEAAYTRWLETARNKVDNACHRLTIEVEQPK